MDSHDAAGVDTPGDEPVATAERAGPTLLESTARLVGVVLFAATGLPYVTAGLVAPGWAVLVLLAIWMVLLVVLIRSWRERPWMVFTLPFIAAVIWVAVIQAGDTFLGWTA